MRKIRHFLVAILLMASLSGFTFLGSGSLASTIASHSGSTTSASSVAFLKRPICPGPGSNDC